MQWGENDTHHYPSLLPELVEALVLFDGEVLIVGFLQLREGRLGEVQKLPDQLVPLLGVCLLRCVENLHDGLLDRPEILVVVAEAVEKLAGKDRAEHSHGVPLRGAVLCCQSYPP